MELTKKDGFVRLCLKIGSPFVWICLKWWIFTFPGFPVSNHHNLALYQWYKPELCWRQAAIGRPSQWVSWARWLIELAACVWAELGCAWAKKLLFPNFFRDGVFVGITPGPTRTLAQWENRKQSCQPPWQPNQWPQWPPGTIPHLSFDPNAVWSFPTLGDDRSKLGEIQAKKNNAQTVLRIGYPLVI